VTGAGAPELSVEFSGEWFRAAPDRPLEIGRGGDLDVDDNPFLHRRFLQLSFTGGLWWIHNLGSRLSTTVTDGSGMVQASLSPGGRLPIVFRTTVIVFTAGPTTYELTVHATAPAFDCAPSPRALDGEPTIAATPLTDSQRLLILALSEPVLRRKAVGTSAIPSSAAAAARLGWTQTRFNRKLDNVCDKLARAGVQGLRGTAGALATNRRARLVEHAVSSRLVTAGDLALLDAPRTSPGPRG
jgi:hypothetical protein